MNGKNEAATSSGRGYAYGGPAFVGGILVGRRARHPAGRLRRLAPDRDRGRLHPDGAHRRDRQVAAHARGRGDRLERSGGRMAQAPTEERARPKGMAWIPGGTFRMGSDRTTPRRRRSTRSRSTGSGSTSTRSRTSSSRASWRRPGTSRSPRTAPDPDAVSRRAAGHARRRARSCS